MAKVLRWGNIRNIHVNNMCSFYIWRNEVTIHSILKQRLYKHHIQHHHKESLKRCRHKKTTYKKSERKGQKTKIRAINTQQSKAMITLTADHYPRHIHPHRHASEPLLMLQDVARDFYCLSEISMAVDF